MMTTIQQQFQVVFGTWPIEVLLAHNQKMVQDDAEGNCEHNKEAHAGRNYEHNRGMHAEGGMDAEGTGGTVTTVNMDGDMDMDGVESERNAWETR